MDADFIIYLLLVPAVIGFTLLFSEVRNRKLRFRHRALEVIIDDLKKFSTREICDGEWLCTRIHCCSKDKDSFTGLRTYKVTFERPNTNRLLFEVKISELTEVTENMIYRMAHAGQENVQARFHGDWNEIGMGFGRYLLPQPQ